MDIATTRSAQEVQAAMVIAKRFPRNATVAISRILAACDRLALAEGALYSYPRGGTSVTGPSIRMAEALARGWGNIDFGVIELEQKNGESTVMSVAWDLETNTRSTKIFTVKHERKASGQIKKLDDPRDIYEMVANQGARRLRACILSIIPGDIIEMAVERCEKTMKDGDKMPMAERIAKVVNYLNGVGVTSEMIEKRVGHKLDALTPTELVNLRKICKSIDDGMANPEEFFDRLGTVESSKPKQPVQTAPAAEPTDEVPMGDDPLLDRAKPHASLLAMIKRDGVTEDQVLVYAKENKLAGKACPEVLGMSESNVLKLAEAWPAALPKVKAIQI